MDIESNTIVPSWKLEKGMCVSPILTTGSGFLRYKLNDRLSVTGFYNQTPCFKFLGRIDGTDMAGEKISSEAAQSIIDEFRSKQGMNPLSLLAIPGNKEAGASGHYRGRYVLLCNPSKRSSDTSIKTSILEESLTKHFHYKLARELNQLDSALVLTTEKASEIYHFRCKELDMVDGNIKIEPLVLWNTPLHPILE
jgi:hypothetical protein